MKMLTYMYISFSTLPQYMYLKLFAFYAHIYTFQVIANGINSVLLYYIALVLGRMENYTNHRNLYMKV
mgnify:CR=1 FL=1